jgi:hypothetical protein
VSGGILHLFLFSEIDRDEWLASRPNALFLRKWLSVPIGQEAKWGPEAVWSLFRREKSLTLPGIELLCRQTHSLPAISLSCNLAHYIGIGIAFFLNRRVSLLHRYFFLPQKL